MESYTQDELRQLRELTMQSYTHYLNLLNDTLMIANLQEGDRLALKLCFQETEEELKLIDSYIEKAKTDSSG